MRLHRNRGVLVAAMTAAACLTGCEVEYHKFSYMRYVDSCFDAVEMCNNRVSQLCSGATSYTCSADHRQCLEVCGRVWSEYRPQAPAVNDFQGAR